LAIDVNDQVAISFVEFLQHFKPRMARITRTFLL
jgi:hypothetical protein